MDSAVAALWTFVGAVVAFLTAAAATLGPLFIQRQRVKLEADIEQLKARASDKAVLAVEDQTRGATVPGVDKVMMAQRMADAATPTHVKIDSADVRAAVTRMKASIPSPSVLPLGLESAGAYSIHVVPGRSVPPGLEDTIPRAPAVPRDTSKEKAPLR